MADFRALFFTEVFGFDPAQEIEAMEKLCSEKGIEHKDFANRNVLVPWDFTNNRPARNVVGPKLYLVDWEEPKKP